MFSQEEDECDSQTLAIAGHEFIVELAENDFNSEKKTLFATFLWNGSKVLAEHLILECESLMKGSSVVEFGAGAGLPSLAAICLNASLVVATDFPCKSILEVLKRNVDRAAESSTSKEAVKTAILSHKWGEDVTDILTVNESKKFDMALAAECLWRHESHESLIISIRNVLKPGGLAYITFSHHVPGLEHDDLAFFSIAEAHGFRTQYTKQFAAPHMWSDRMSTIYLHVLELLH